MNERRKSALDDVNDEALAKLEAEMAGDLRDLRTAATVYAERVNVRTGSAALPAPGRRSATWAGARLGWAGAALAAVAIAVGGGLHMANNEGGAPATAGVTEAGTGSTAAQGRDASAVSDEALLDQIQSDLSTGVPAAMQPLATNGAQRSKAGDQSRSE